ncbi:hydroxysteroid dehydrogenase 6 [Artemisia annua]|uniref:Hydroxysteroid dehydrogenase 6 n=2 Tax=Artemisia annua TaxID=35608 RepID=A0A2U1MAX7_ARTAN|nr:hydroxysteroid dehydrogenase 6 [Artemisia annua]
MDFVDSVLNLVAPIATICALFCFTPLYIGFKLLWFIFRSIFKEDVAGKVVLIVGASSGIGEHVAYEYSKRGACLVLAARRKHSLQEVADTAVSLGAPDAIAIRADVSNIEDCKRLINKTISHFGKLDHLVNCAGITSMSMLEDITDITRFTQVLDTNFWGYVYMTHLSIPHLRRSKGKIVAIASSATWMPVPRMNIYNASKAAVVSFYESLRMELGSEVGITIVTPGLTESEMSQGKIMDKDGEMVIDQDMRDAEMSIVPIELAAKSAVAIVDGASRGDLSLAVPRWVQTTIYWVAFFPEMIDWVNHWFLLAEPGASPLDAPSKMLLDVPGLRHIVQPDSVISPVIKEYDYKLVVHTPHKKRSDVVAVLIIPLEMLSRSCVIPSCVPFFVDIALLTDKPDSRHLIIIINLNQPDMDFVDSVLNLVAPIATICALFCFTPLYIGFKVLWYIFRSISKEDVAGKVVLIVGASSGIGEHVAYEYAKRGACLVLAARRKHSLQEVADTAVSLGAPDAIAIRADVSNIEDCKRLINKTISHFGKLDHLVNCAGITSMSMLEDITDITRFTQVMDTNFWGYVYMTYLSIPHLRRSKGKIVVIASSATWMPVPRMNIYNASKAAVVSFYESLRMELGSEVGITIVTPGLTESEMSQGKIMDKDGEMVIDQDMRDAEMSIVPIELATKSAVAIVDGASRGDLSLAVPQWVQTTIYWVAFFPEMVDWVNHWFLLAEPGASPLDAPSKMLLDVPGLRHIVQPDSVISPVIKEYDYKLVVHTPHK